MKQSNRTDTTSSAENSKVVGKVLTGGNGPIKSNRSYYPDCSHNQAILSLARLLNESAAFVEVPQ